jgi:ABC-type multidrug transport system fused ATPase/permease subunit
MREQFTIFSILKTTIRNHPAVFILMCASAAGTVLLNLIPPLLLGNAVDGLTAGTAITVLFTVGYFAVLALSGIVSSLQEAMITVFGQKITHALRTSMYKKMEHLPSSYFVSHDSGAITSRIVSDVDTVEDLFSSGIIEMVSDLAGVISILVMIFLKSTGLGLIMLAVLPLLAWMTYVFQKKMRKAQLQQRKAIEEENANIPETRHNIRSIHVFHCQSFMIDHYDRAIRKGYTAMEKNNVYDSIYSPIIISLSAAVTAVTVCLAGEGGIFQSLFGMTAGTIVTIISYISGVFEPLESIGMEIQSIQSAVAGVTRINEFMAEDEMSETEETQEDLSKPILEIKDMDFAYGDEGNIFTDMNMTVSKGESIMITGRTGAGKSTLFKLILGLYSPQKGSVRIFGRDAACIPAYEKRKVFGCVEQSFHPVSGNVREQITMHDTRITEEQLDKSLMISGMKEAVEQLPEGLSTPYDDSLFSQGQKQLLSIARATASDPQILLLDEITANLDSGTEKILMESLHRASANRTVISISHRLFETEHIRTVEIGEND